MRVKKQGDRSLLTLVTDVAEKYHLSVESVTDLLAQTFENAFLKEFPDNKVEVVIDLKKSKIEIWRQLQVVTDEFFKGEGFEDEETLIPVSKLDTLRPFKKNPSKPKVGDFVYKEVDIEDFDSKLTTNIQIFFKKLTQAENSRVICQKWLPMQGKVIEGTVEEIIENKDDGSVMKIIVSMSLPEDGSVARGIILRSDLVWCDGPNGSRVYENMTLGNVYLFYIKEVSEMSARFPISLSRTDPAIVKYLMAKHISEIDSDLVEIKAISRIAGVKTKVLVHAKNANIDPVGCCIGPKGKRLKIISGELMNEKIDVILWREDPIQNIINSFVTGKIIGYKVDENMENSITLVATVDNLLSCIGRRGSNIKLVYMLTGWKINLKTIQEAKDEGLEYVSIDDDKFVSSNKISERMYKMHFKKTDVPLTEQYFSKKRSIANDSEER